MTGQAESSREQGGQGVELEQSGKEKKDEARAEAALSAQKDCAFLRKDKLQSQSQSTCRVSACP